jgi:hypothetical protein
MTKHYRLKATQFLSCNYDSVADATRKLIAKLEIGDSVTIPANHWLAEKRVSLSTRKTIRNGDQERRTVQSVIQLAVASMRSNGTISDLLSFMILPNGDVYVNKIPEKAHRVSWKPHLENLKKYGQSVLADDDFASFNNDENRVTHGFSSSYIREYGNSDFHVEVDNDGKCILKVGRDDRISRSGDVNKTASLIFSNLMKNVGSMVSVPAELDNASVRTKVYASAKESNMTFSISKNLGVCRLQPN